MEFQHDILNKSEFKEEEWINLLFMLNDTQKWLNDLSKKAILQVPIKNRRKLFKKKYYMSISALAHILERHYHKVNRYPMASKFTIPVATLLAYLRDAAEEPVMPSPRSLNLQRVIHTEQVVGIVKNSIPVKTMTVLTDKSGNIVTAFPGVCEMQ